MAREKKAFPLRLDAELHRAIEKWAEDEFRSVNGHIEYLLREALRKAGRLPSRALPAKDEAAEDSNGEAR
ncbi:Arc family DNA-binding protein [Cohnella xylanilytica]|uniref:Arc family DNA-binding protein n=1 Tax=Cohnella xylanilytica TaxID=557555 RepID=A0A841U811_9BACL|nr:Arc family DNA-binding protein [Cohnella xylanilytica]MBB6695168.1 Arc family DNA-binding protein [Cohnella xylanilytica]